MNVLGGVYIQLRAHWGLLHPAVLPGTVISSFPANIGWGEGPREGVKDIVNPPSKSPKKDLPGIWGAVSHSSAQEQGKSRGVTCCFRGQ